MIQFMTFWSIWLGIFALAGEQKYSRQFGMMLNSLPGADVGDSDAKAGH